LDGTIKSFFTAEGAEMNEKDRLDKISREIIGAAIDVHRMLGPGLLESAYATCLQHELLQRGLKVVRELPVPIRYKGITLDCGYRLDLLVEESVVVEVKAVDALAPIHQAQLMSHLRLCGLRVGLLINFNVRMLKHGLKRVVNDFPDSASSAFSAVNTK
jgi:GxxExxY protein